jgi:uncharacterized protein (TIGR03435 family)
MLLLLGLAVTLLAPPQRLQFDVASIKIETSAPPSAGDKGFACRGQDGLWRASFQVGTNVFNAPRGRCVGRYVSLADLIGAAYDTPSYYVDLSDLKLPDNLSKYGVSIEAVAADVSTVTIDQLRIMLQNLLADRFKLRFHRDTLTSVGCVLSVAEGGFKLKPATGDMKPPTVVHDRNEDVIRGKSNLRTLADFLAGSQFRAGLDRTKLEGMYEYTITLNRVFVSNVAAARGAREADTAVAQNPRDVSCEQGFADPQPGRPRNGVFEYVPPLATALQRQLGLTIKSESIQADRFAVDGLEPPSEN